MKNLLILITVTTLTFSCNNSKHEHYSAFEKNLKANNHPGKKLMETNCYACHSATANEENRLAPPMIAVKMRYLKDNTTKEAFINDLKDWMKNPNAENAKMYGAVKRFGVMPKQILPDETIEKIGNYIYDYDIEKPDWFDNHYKKMHQINKNNE
ncbi:c-type cytochrome [Siansivirga zeaxanthinifaciens]|uniref:Cytochrome c domain-containing protein n=1 Tax=Siansivirga zeaxanthinifaciens CC-SAMT-1 TaxID=1454006 RepID=A0A0C5WNF2_9FLAO|nr:c-type cytochrome [Siansivirga zeaxanthinifaciens]AJR04425.1 hypothetical protein AW14_12950 [Siansivirga zeaxanthinifaciens CC-SAMT-1]